MKPRILQSLTLIPLLAILSGCTATKVEFPDGTKFSSTRFADFTRIGKVEAGLGTNSFSMEGYDSDRQTAAVEMAKTVSALAEAIAKLAATP